MKLLFENWRKYLNEDKELLDEGLSDWWDALALDVGSLKLKQTPDHITGMIMDKIRNTDAMNNLKGGALVAWLKTLKGASQIPGTSSGGSTAVGAWPSPEAEEAHKARQLDNFISYAEDNPEETLEDMVNSADIPHARSPEIRAALSAGDPIAKIAGFLGAIGGYLGWQTYGPPDAKAPGKRDDKV